MLKAIFAAIRLLASLLGIVEKKVDSKKQKSDQADGAALQRGQDTEDELKSISDASDAAIAVDADPSSLQQQLEADPANRNRGKRTSK